MGGKEELLREVVQGVLDENVVEAKRIAALDVDADEKLRLLVKRLIASYEEHYPYMYVYIQEDMTKVARQEDAWARQMVRQTRRFESLVKSVIEEGIRDDHFRKDMDVVLIANALYGMVNWTHRWFKPGRGRSADEVAESFAELLLHGLVET